MALSIRAEEARDRPRVHEVNAAAFARADEADLVDALRAQVDDAISLVAEQERVIGHILFTPVTLDGSELRLMGLAPMAVAPEHQRAGVGSALVREGLSRCRERGVDAVVVLGHPDYYPRFGFAPASRFGVRSEYEAPDEAFMLVELREGALKGAAGLVRYHAAFGAV